MKFSESNVVRFGKIFFLAWLILALPILFLIVDELFNRNFVTFILYLAVLIFCFGPGLLFQDFDKYVKQRHAADAQGESQKEISSLFGKKLPQDVVKSDDMVIKTVLIETNTYFTAVLFWFIVFGPFGALLYRTLCLSAQDASKHEETKDVQEKLKFALACVDWIPARILALMFALVGEFSAGVKCLIKCFSANPLDNAACLEECGLASLQLKKASDPNESLENLVEARAFVDRAVIFYTILMAILVFFV